MTRGRFVAFFSIVSSVWMLIHLFVGLTLAPAPAVLPAGPVRALWWLGIVVLAVLPIAAMVAGRRGRPGRIKTVLEWTGFTSMGLSTMLLVLAVAANALHVRAWLDPRWVTPGILAVAGLATAAGFWRSRRPSVVRVAIPITGLHQDLEGFRIVQLSDLHIGPTLKRAFVERVVKTVGGLDPDLIALTGDVADGHPPAMREEVAPLADLGAPHGKFFVTGNHEYYWDALGWVREIEALGFDALVNSHRLIQRGTARLLVAGVTDGTASGWTPGHQSDAQRAVSGAPDADVKVMLAHQPSSAFTAQRMGFDLQLSGHTHGGQYFPFNYVVRLFQPFVHGLHRLQDMWLYVSRGTGYWGPPMRIGAPSEITVIELVRA
jgi:predicted MPP superfamily phosphohydrolase